VHESAFAVEGMFCGGCAATVERSLRRLPGVSDVSVSFLTDAAFVRHDPERAPVAVLVRRLADLGYPVRPVGERDARTAQDAFLRSHRIRLAVAVGFGMWVMMATIARYATELPDARYAWWLGVASGVFSIPVLAYSGAPFMRLGWRGLRMGVPGMESLILLATLAALGASLGTLASGGSAVWFEVPVMLIVFQLVARLGDVGARRRAADAVRAVLDRSPERAWRVDGSAVSSVAVLELASGQTVESRAGERLPVDGTVLSGTALLDRALMSGESLPVPVGPGDAVLAGTTNLDGVLRIRVDAARGQRTLDRLAATVGRALNARSDLMRFVDRIAGRLVPSILVAALVAFGVALAGGATLAEATVRALATLVVSCPCALSLAVPMVVAAGAASAARAGIVLRDPAVFERAHRIDTVLLDKTGTLTRGQLEVARVAARDGHDGDAVLALAVRVQGGSNHPLAQAIRRHAVQRRGAATANVGEAGGGEKVVASDPLDGLRERAGAGVEGVLPDGRAVLAGSARWLEEHGVATASLAPVEPGCSRVLVALDGTAIGAIELFDTVREDAVALLQALRARGLQPVIASGDTPGAVEGLAAPLGLEWHAALRPDDKHALIERLQGEGRCVAFVGDGLNDAPALAVADLGIATGDASDLARSAAALSVLHGGLANVDLALRLSADAARALRRNLAFALLYNAVLIPAAVLGYVHPLLAVLAMAVSTVSIGLSVLPLVRVRASASGRRAR